MFTEDLSAFFNTDDFAIAALWTLQGGGSFTIQVIFDNAYRGIGLGEVDQAAREPEVLARDDQIAQGAGMKRGDTLQINAVTYKVGNIEPDGTGVTRIALRK